jgi:hypothetical protein
MVTLKAQWFIYIFACIYITCFNIKITPRRVHKVYLCVYCDSQNDQLFSEQNCSVFCIMQTHCKTGSEIVNFIYRNSCQKGLNDFKDAAYELGLRHSTS